MVCQLLHVQWQLHPGHPGVRRYPESYPVHSPACSCHPPEPSNSAHKKPATKDRFFASLVRNNLTRNESLSGAGRGNRTLNGHGGTNVV